MPSISTYNVQDAILYQNIEVKAVLDDWNLAKAKHMPQSEQDRCKHRYEFKLNILTCLKIFSELEKSH